MKELDAIASEDFEIAMGARLPPKAMRAALLRVDACKDLLAAIEQRALTPVSLRAWVQDLLQSFKRGERFRYEAALSALAVCLEEVRTDFAAEYIRDLAELDIAEMTMCTLIARECLRERNNRPANASRTFPADVSNLPKMAAMAISHRRWSHIP